MTVYGIKSLAWTGREVGALMRAHLRKKCCLGPRGNGRTCLSHPCGESLRGQTTGLSFFEKVGWRFKMKLYLSPWILTEDLLGGASGQRHDSSIESHQEMANYRNGFLPVTTRGDKKIP